MKVQAIVAAAVGLAMAGCGYTAEEIRTQPAKFEVTVAAPWDKVGSCLARIYGDELDIRYVPVPSESAAELVATLVVTGPLSQARRNLFVIDIKGSGPTVVSYRQQPSPTSDSIGREARERIERCGKA